MRASGHHPPGTRDDEVRTRRFGQLLLNQPWHAIWTPRMIALASLASVAVAYSSVEIMGRSFMLRRPGPASEIVTHVLAYAFLIFTLTLIAGAVMAGFGAASRPRLLVTVMTSYFSLMLVFASIDYEAAFFGDFADAVRKYDLYRSAAAQHLPPRPYADRRAFYGLERRFWSGVDWQDPDGFPAGLPGREPDLTPAEMQQRAATEPLAAVVAFIPSARLGIFADCLHFSVTTMTTVGYGDITPRSVAARISADLEAVCNTLLLIVGLGMIFGNWRSGRTPRYRAGGIGPDVGSSTGS